MKLKLLLAVIFIVIPCTAMAEVFSSLDSVGDEHWKQRDSMPSVISAIDAYEKKLANEPSNIQLIIRLSMAFYWKGMVLQSQKADTHDIRKAFQEGINYGEKALTLEPESVAANFWFTTNLGKHSEEIGVMKSLSKVPTLRDNIMKAMAQDKFYYYGGSQRYLSKLAVSLPGMLRKRLSGITLEDAEKMLLEVIEQQPFFILSRIYLAEVYMKLKKKDLAKVQLEKALEAKESDLPEFAPEIRFYGKLAQRKMAEFF